jgi:hypothetical protein
MSEHVVRIHRRDMDRLREWLQHPNGAFSVDNHQVVFESVEDGGILVRTRDWQHGDS